VRTPTRGRGGANATAALVGTNPESLDLAEMKVRVADRTNTNATDRMTVESSDDERSRGGHQLLNVQVLVLFAPAVAAIELVDRRVIDAERTV
jgi:hypothetical protein